MYRNIDGMARSRLRQTSPRKVAIKGCLCDSKRMRIQSTAINAIIWAACVSLLVFCSQATFAADVDFQAEIAPILQQHCVKCHSGSTPDGDFSLATKDAVIDGAGEGWAVIPGDPDASMLLEVVSGDEPRMPEDGPPLSEQEIELLRRWISEGALWPDEIQLTIKDDDWWSLQPIVKPTVPKLENLSAEQMGDAVPKHWQRNPIDAFVLEKLVENGLSPSQQAEKRTLVRRLYYDLHGLPPTPKQVEEFVSDPDPEAYPKLVDQLLDSPRYGERWARHWLDVVHYADTHGYDKDKVREHAWPYRDYVIRALNDDKPYAQFVREQLAGDALADNPADGIPALGFIAAGPFDWVGQIEVSEATMEGKRVRNLDRDDMVTSAMNTFASVTAQCARCHNHKFDPITQEDYYRLQAVFAAVDRADREYQPDPEVASKRRRLENSLHEVRTKIQELEDRLSHDANSQITVLRRQAERLRTAGDSVGEKPEFGYHSQIASSSEQTKWVQIDLGEVKQLNAVLLFPCHDNFNNIGAGFGFPVRYKVEISNDENFVSDVIALADLSNRDQPMPGVAPQAFAAAGTEGRYLRITALKLAPRQNDFIFALGEVIVLDSDGINVAKGKNVTAFDSIEAPVRWQKQNLVDGYYFGQRTLVDEKALARTLIDLRTETETLKNSEFGKALSALEAEEKQLRAALDALPAMQKVFAAATKFPAQGNFKPTAGEPREIFVLKRGEEKLPDTELGPVSPGALSVLTALDDCFTSLDNEAPEIERRMALAKWLTNQQNPLFWRSIVNRVWLYHFGQAIVDTPNDFGRMGSLPSHPALLDYLASRFRDEGGSLKDLHRLICTSATYQQAVEYDDKAAKVDGENRLLWRANRQRLDAESIRDAALMAAGKLDLKMGGPGFRAFGFKDDHSPHYDYGAHDPDSPDTSRRSIYRFIVRSVPDPLMTTLDCADPTISVPKRSETLTSLQALAMLNDAFMVRMAEHFAERVQRETQGLDQQVRLAFQLALQRSPDENELQMLVDAAEKLGMPNVCRMIFNLNEFVFVD